MNQTTLGDHPGSPNRRGGNFAAPLARLGRSQTPLLAIAAATLFLGAAQVAHAEAPVPAATNVPGEGSGNSAQDAMAKSPEASDTGAADASGAAAADLWQAGPKAIELGNEVKVELGSGYAFLPPEPAKKLLEQNGSFYNEGVLGLFTSTEPDQEWFVVARFDDSGFVKDDEEVDGEEILSSLRDGLDELNEERSEHGFKPLSLDGWAEAPRYDKAKHQLVWALIVSDPDGKSVNLNTRILGRRGYVSLNLVTDPKRLADYRHHADALLAATQFAGGARYEDFDEKTDKVAEYGLAGLVMAGAGLGAAKLVKLGLLAKFSKVILGLLIAGKKVVIAALVGLGLLVKQLLTGKRNSTTAASTDTEGSA